VETHGLPVTSPDLFGRDEQLQCLDEAWADEHINVISLVAFGGVGKSALVNRWLGHMAVDDYRGARRVYGWSAYSQGSKDRVATADLFIDQALRFFGDPGPGAGSTDQRAVRLADLIRRDRTLLVLDGIESLQYAPGEGEGHIKDTGLRTLVRELAARSSGLCVITTRKRVADLAAYETTTCPKIDLEELKLADGAALLRSLGVTGPEEELQAASGESGGHALALTLLGTLLRDRWGGDVRKRREIGPLEHEITQGGHARRVVDSYEEWLGDGPERAVLRMLGLFDRPAKAAAIRALREDPPIDGLTDKLDNWDNALIRLRRARLVAAAETSDPDTLDAHPWVREHFGLKLRAEDEAAWRAGHDRLFEYYRGEACTKKHARTLEEMAPLYAAVTHGCAANRHREVWEEVFEGRIRERSLFYRSRKLYSPGLDLAALSSFFDKRWNEPSSLLEEDLQARVCEDAGLALRLLGRRREARQPIQMGLSIAKRRGDWRNGARCANNLSELCLEEGRVSEAVDFARQSAEWADAVEDSLRQVISRCTLGDALHQAGQMEQSRREYRSAELILRTKVKQEGDSSAYRFLFARSGFRYCDLLIDLGHYDQANRRARHASRRISGRDPSDLDVALNHLTMGRCCMLAASSAQTSQSDEAETHLESATDGLRRTGQQNQLPRGLLARAEFYRFTGDRGAARKALDKAREIADPDHDTAMKLFVTDIHLLSARLDLDDGNRQQAQEHVATARALIEETGYHRRDGELAELEELAGM